jgi:hypothetical protein
MRKFWARAAAGILGMTLGAGLCMAQDGAYADPDGAFALHPPEGWQTMRTPLSDAAWVTTFSKGDAHIAIVVVMSAVDLDPSMLEGTGGALLVASIGEIQQRGEIFSQSTKQVPAEIAGASGQALRCELEFTSLETGNARLKGTLISLLGRRAAVLAAYSAPVADGDGFRSAEASVKTLAIEARVPAGGSALAKNPAPPPKVSLPAADLSGMANKFKGEARRESRGEILCPGNPPLTYGSVASFAELVGECFDVQLSEAEFEATRQRFIEYYQKQDAQGKAILAEGWTKLLKEIRAAEGPQRAAMVDDVRKVMADRFRSGAQAGIGWAVTMEAAIAKRSQSVAKAAGQKPAFAKDPRFDRDFSQADLEAAVEMLYFMWVASGRDASLVTADTVAQVQVSLVQGYATFPPDLQYVLANAQQIYAGLRSQWGSADAGQRLQMALVFGQQLDALGFTVPSPRKRGGSTGSAWSDWEGKSRAQFAGEMVVGLAGSSYKSAW